MAEKQIQKNEDERQIAELEMEGKKKDKILLLISSCSGR